MHQCAQNKNACHIQHVNAKQAGLQMILSGGHKSSCLFFVHRQMHAVARFFRIRPEIEQPLLAWEKWKLRRRDLPPTLCSFSHYKTYQWAAARTMADTLFFARRNSRIVHVLELDDLS
jgi:hypothetical protein